MLVLIVACSAQSQGFRQDTDVILLATNLLKKELKGASASGNMKGVYEAGLAVNCTSNIVTEELASDVLPELTNLTAHPQPYLRKKAVLCLFKVFCKYPQGLRLTFSKIQNCLKDSNSSVVSCAVNVITELSYKNPRNYLHMAPDFFNLLTSSSNNWMLIKVVKLLGSLVPEEPRLARKLLDPLASIAKNTQAKSLLFEVVYTITLCLPYCRKQDGSMPAQVPDVVLLCAQTLRDFVEQPDQNLKYLGLVGFASLMQSHPRVLSAPDYRPLILACLSDEDVTIRSRALELLSGMTTRKNTRELVTQLLVHVRQPGTSTAYKQDLVAKLIAICASDKYALVTDFEWYVQDVLLALGHERGIEPHGELICAQLIDVSLRVMPVRSFAVRRAMENLCCQSCTVSHQPIDDDVDGQRPTVDLLYDGDNGRGKHIMPALLPALAWIVGEYSNLIQEGADDPDDELDLEDTGNSTGTYHCVIHSLTDPFTTQKLDSNTQKVFVQAAMKVFAAASADTKVSKRELEACVHDLHVGLSVYVQSTNVDVVERAFRSLELLRALDLTPSSDGDSPPGLVTIEDEDDEDDLLGMGGTSAVKPQTVSSVVTNGKPLSSRVHDASDLLVYALKPSPMKPISSKAQRKKRDTISKSVDLESPLDSSLIQDLLDEESKDRQRTKLSIESVSFTSQEIKERTEVNPVGSTPPLVENSAPSFTDDASESFQKTFMSTTNTRSRNGDPFYLSAPSPDASSEQQKLDPNRLATIQLGDDDDEIKRTKKYKKKKKKDKKTAAVANSILSSFDDGAPTIGTSTSQVYDSDEDDNDYPSVAVMNPKKKQSQAFDPLAQVDLTTPLRDDEVMPERKHRVVQQKPEKKSKKKSKLKKEKEACVAVTPGGVSDLLSLTGTDSAALSEQAVPSAMVGSPVAASGNAISTAFGDLLDLGSAPAPQLPGAAAFPSIMGSTTAIVPAPVVPQTVSSGKTSSKRPWMKAAVKSSSATVSALATVTLHYRVYRSSENSSVAIACQVVNPSSTAIDQLSLVFKNQQPIVIGSIPANGGSTETQKSDSSFPISTTEDSKDIKGSLQTPQGKVPVKLVLPATVHCNPEYAVTLDSVAAELATSGWTSDSAKLPIPSGVAADSVLITLGSFLRAHRVEDGINSNMNATFASQSAAGTPIRVLVKITADGKNAARVDVKTRGDALLASSVAADIKRVVLS